MTRPTQDGATAVSTEAMQRRTMWRYVAACALAWGVLLALPASLQGPWYVLFGISAVTFVARRVRHLPDEVRFGATTMVLAGASSLTGAVVRALQGAATGVEYPFPSVADVFPLLSYALLLTTIGWIVRRRIGRLRLDVVLDAVVAGIAAGLLQWQLVLLPYLETTTAGRAEVTMNLIYSTCSLLLVMAAVLALVAGGHRSASNRLLAGGLGAAVAIDITATLITAGRVPEALRLVVSPSVFLLGGAGLLHPSVRLLTRRPSDAGQLRRLTTKRIGVLAAALLAPPALLVAEVLRDDRAGLLLPAVCSLALAPIVVVRLGGLVKDNQVMADLEATLRSVGERLVAAETPTDVARTITVGAEQVLGASFVDGGLVLDPVEVPGADRGAGAAAGAGGDPGDPTTAALAALAVLPPERRLGQLVELCVGRGDHHWYGTDVAMQGEAVGHLVVGSTTELTEGRRGALAALSREAAIALRAVERTELSVRQRSEDRFGALIDNSSDIVTVVGADGRPSYVSPVAVRLLGYPLDYLGAHDVNALVHPDDRAAATELLAGIRRGSREATELRLRHLSGTFHWFEVVGVDLSAEPDIGGVVLTAREIGDRKAAEERLQLSEARFKALVQHSSDLVLVVHPGDGVRYASPSAAHLIGLAADDLLGATPTDLFDDSKVHWAGLVGADAPERSELEFGFRNRRGDWVHLAATVTDLRAEPAVGGFVVNARDVTERTGMLQRLRHQATHDELTGLPNRVLAGEELGGMLRRNGGASTVAVVSLDLDDFKDVNDSLGHAIGDELLRAVAERIRARLSYGDLAARVGGDEFVVVLERSRGEDRVLEVAQGLIEALAQPFTVEGRELHVAASAGVAFDHDRSAAAEVLLRDADTAMYRAKQAGKRQCVVFEPEMRTASFDRLELRADLARAIDTDQFRAVYQPIVDLASGRITGCEALVRWEHPTRGLLSPAIFVPLAEETGLIVELGEWMLRRACRDLAAWRGTHPDVAGELTIAVNLSAQELHGERLVPTVLDALGESHLPADRLVLEVTESNLLADTETVAERMRKLRELGAKLAIDDFGTGYSSLGYVQRYDFDILKIDRSFVEGMDRATNRRIVTAVLDLARELDVRTVAEGIETVEQRDALAALGCDRGQGYWWSRPVPAAEFLELLAAQRSAAEPVPAAG